ERRLGLGRQRRDLLARLDLLSRHRQQALVEPSIERVQLRLQLICGLAVRIDRAGTDGGDVVLAIDAAEVHGCTLARATDTAARSGARCGGPARFGGNGAGDGNRTRVISL